MWQSESTNLWSQLSSTRSIVLEFMATIVCSAICSPSPVAATITALELMPTMCNVHSERVYRLGNQPRNDGAGRLWISQSHPGAWFVVEDGIRSAMNFLGSGDETIMDRAICTQRRYRYGNRQTLSGFLARSLIMRDIPGSKISSLRRTLQT